MEHVGELVLSYHVDVDAYFNFSRYTRAGTLDAFKSCAIWAADETFSEQSLLEAKMQIFASVDSPTAPAAKGISDFLRGSNQDEKRMERRETLLDVTADDVRVAMTEHVLPAMAASGGVQERGGSSACIFGPTSSRDRFEGRDGWTTREV